MLPGQSPGPSLPCRKENTRNAVLCKNRIVCILVTQFDSFSGPRPRPQASQEHSARTPYVCYAFTLYARTPAGWESAPSCALRQTTEKQLDSRNAPSTLSRVLTHQTQAQTPQTPHALSRGPDLPEAWAPRSPARTASPPTAPPMCPYLPSRCLPSGALPVPGSLQMAPLPLPAPTPATGQHRDPRPTARCRRGRPSRRPPAITTRKRVPVLWAGRLA